MNGLNEKLAFIGIRLAGENFSSESYVAFIDIEKTIIEASYEVFEDGRLFSLLLTWMSIHGNYLITEKLIKFYNEYSKQKGECPWFNALLIWASEECSHKFRRWAKRESKKVYFGDKQRAQSLIDFKGGNTLFKKYNIYIPNSSLRIRKEDVLSAHELAKVNRQYRNRYLYGASWRADIVTAIELGIRNPYQISKLIGCSYEPANRIFREYELVSGEIL